MCQSAAAATTRLLVSATTYIFYSQTSVSGLKFTTHHNKVRDNSSDLFNLPKS